MNRPQKAALQPTETTSEMTTFVFIRHGETGANQRGEYAGHTATRLTRRGVQQAQRTAEMMCKRDVRTLLCGPLTRTRQTAKAIGAACGVAPEPVAALDEIGLGHWQGLRKDEVAARYPQEWSIWRERPEAFAPPGFESLAQASARVIGLLAEVHEARPGSEVVLVTHEALIRLAVLHVLGLPIAGYRRIKVMPCSLSEIVYGTSRSSLLSLNCTRHLA